METKSLGSAAVKLKRKLQCFLSQIQKAITILLTLLLLAVNRAEVA